MSFADKGDDISRMPMWKTYLYHLQQKAPTSKRILCQKEISSKPPYYGREFHGAITREDVDFLLTIGGEGAYLIRESQRAPGQFTLAIRFEGATKNFKLYYDGQHYVGEKRFETVQDLVQDGLITFYLEEKAADYIAALSNESNYAESPYVAYHTQKLIARPTGSDDANLAPRDYDKNSKEKRSQKQQQQHLVDAGAYTDLSADRSEPPMTSSSGGSGDRRRHLDRRQDGGGGERKGKENRNSRHSKDYGKERRRSDHIRENSASDSSVLSDHVAAKERAKTDKEKAPKREKPPREKPPRANHSHVETTADISSSSRVSRNEKVPEPVDRAYVNVADELPVLPSNDDRPYQNLPPEVAARVRGDLDRHLVSDDDVRGARGAGSRVEPEGDSARGHRGGRHEVEQSRHVTPNRASHGVNLPVEGARLSHLLEERLEENRRDRNSISAIAEAPPELPPKAQPSDNMASSRGENDVTQQQRRDRKSQQRVLSAPRGNGRLFQDHRVSDVTLSNQLQTSLQTQNNSAKVTEREAPFCTPPSSPPTGRQLGLHSYQMCENYLQVMGSEKPHNFKLYTFKGPHWCDFCANFLWGLIAQGVKCQDCGFNAHKKCSEKVPHDCLPHMKYVKRVFGIDLTTLVKAQNTLIPGVVEITVKEIERRGLETEGIYRVAGFHDDVEEIRMLIDKEGEFVDISSARYDDQSTITSVLKLYFRLLPIPLVTFEVYFSVMEIIRREELNEPKKVDLLRTALTALPPAHLHTLKFVCAHLHRVSELHSQNMMNAENLAIVFAPTLLRSPDTDPLTSLSAVKYERELVELLILHSEKIFNS